MRRPSARRWNSGAEALLTKPIDFGTLRNEIDMRVGSVRMTAQILVVDDEPDLEALIQQKFRHQIRDGSVVFSVRPRRRRCLGGAEGATAPSTWW